VSLTFELTITDDGDLPSTDTCIVNVTWINETPTADAGPDQSVNEGDEVVLNGFNSSDPDDGIYSYHWEQMNEPKVTIFDPTAASLKFTAPDVGPGGAALIFQLTVTDNGGLKATDTCIVNVSWIDDTPANLPPIADAGPDQTVNEGVQVTLDGSKSDDPDDGIATYEWKQIDGPSVTLTDIFDVSPAFAAPDVGPQSVSLTFQLTVTDNEGLKSTSTCIVNVSWINLPPIADAGPDQPADEGQLVTLDGSNSDDPDDGIANYEWKLLQGPSVTLSDPSAVSPSFLTPDVGSESAELIFQLTVADHGDLKSTSTCKVNVAWVDIPAPNLPPIADAGPDQTVSVGDSVTLDGTKSTDPDDGFVTHLWQQVDGPKVQLFNPPPDKPKFTAPQVGLDGEFLTFQLTVTDKEGVQDTDSCVVKVLPADKPDDKLSDDKPSSLERITDRVKMFLQDQELSPKTRKRLEKSEKYLAKAVPYYQKGSIYKAFKKVEQAFKKLKKASEEIDDEDDVKLELEDIVSELNGIIQKELRDIQLEAEKSIAEAVTSKGEHNKYVKKAKKFRDKALSSLAEGKKMSKVAKEFSKSIKNADKAVRTF